VRNFLAEVEVTLQVLGDLVFLVRLRGYALMIITQLVHRGAAAEQLRRMLVAPGLSGDLRTAQKAFIS